VDHHDNLVGSESVGVGNVVLIDVGDPLDFQKVVARTETAELVFAAIFGFL